MLLFMLMLCAASFRVQVGEVSASCRLTGPLQHCCVSAYCAGADTPPLIVACYKAVGDASDHHRQ
jgi:hypothetical protein